MGCYSLSYPFHLCRSFSRGTWMHGLFDKFQVIMKWHKLTMRVIFSRLSYCIQGCSSGVPGSKTLGSGKGGEILHWEVAHSKSQELVLTTFEQNLAPFLSLYHLLKIYLGVNASSPAEPPLQGWHQCIQVVKMEMTSALS